MSGSSSLDGFKLEGRIALVTGAGRGIGRACALQLANAGARVIGVARTASDLQELATTHPAIETWQFDVTGNEILAQIESLDRLDVLVNNAGTNRPQPFLEVELEALDEMLALNQRSLFRTAQAAARVMVKSGSGSIINIGSQMGHVGAAHRSVYCMTKHGVEGLTKAMAVELAPMGVRVNTVAPTFIETPLTQPMLEDPKFSQSVLAKIPMGRLGSVEDVANAVLFLACDASGLVTGDSLKVDGGWTAV
ncbi:MAG: SDR family NAD(P)-dependent oxidoreductase [Pseudomonadota bacterium]